MAVEIVRTVPVAVLPSFLETVSIAAFGAHVKRAARAGAAIGVPRVGVRVAIRVPVRDATAPLVTFLIPKLVPFAIALLVVSLMPHRVAIAVLGPVVLVALVVESDPRALIVPTVALAVPVPVVVPGAIDELLAVLVVR